MDEKFYHSYVALGKLYIRKGKTKEAVNYLKKALKKER